ncbi:MAG TPA: hypothetical protein VGJ51_09535 [Candidatus Angelobacter sp.]
MPALTNEVMIGSIVLQVLLAMVVLTKRTWRSYPAFSTYVFFSVFEAAFISVLRHRGIGYFYPFWACEAIGIVLGLAVVREIFTNLFSPHPALRKLATVTFRVAVVALIVLACTVFYAESGNARGIANGIMLAEEAARIVELGLIMFLFLSSSAFGLHWRQNEFGIALGLGTCAAVELFNVTLMTHVSREAAQIFSLVRSCSFNLSLVIWLGYLLVPERTTSSAEIPRQDQMEQWNQAVMELISR